MAYVNGAEYDFFVSYAHVDNMAIEPADHGWVDALIRALEVDLAMRLGRRDAAQIWRDAKSLRGNHNVDDHINDQVRRSALFVMVLSHGYLASDYCLAELEAFVGRNPSDRIFVVYKDRVDPARYAIPAPIANSAMFQFWAPDRHDKPRVLGWPLPHEDTAENRQQYFRKVEDLGRDLAAAMDLLNAATGTPARPAAEPRQGAVLLAEVTDDLDARREEVRRYLDQAGIAALPSIPYRFTRADFERGFAADLPGCKAFVQLLGPLAGKAPADIPEGFARLQLLFAQKAGIPILQWRDPGTDPEAAATPAQRELLLGELVQAMPFEAFKRSVAALFDPPAPVRAAPPPSFLFVNAADVDLGHAERLVAGLGDAVNWGMPFYAPDADPADIQEEVEAQLLDSDGLVFLYGDANPRWVRGQLQLYRKLAPRRARQPTLLALVSTPPGPKVSLQIGLQGLQHMTSDEAPGRIRTALGA